MYTVYIQSAQSLRLNLVVITKIIKLAGLLRTITTIFYCRGIHLGKPDLQKTWEKFEQKKSIKEQKEQVGKNELEARFLTISQKNEV